MNCVYCGNPIIVESREHIIQNAIGGLEESTDICCPKCNNYISRFIDKPFVTTFNPIIARIDSFAKTNKSIHYQHIQVKPNMKAKSIL